MMAQRLFQTLAVLTWLVVLAALPIPALAQDGSDYPEYSGSYALLIGMSEYDYYESWAPLPNVPGYLEDIKRTLISKGFEVFKVKEEDVLLNPTSRQFLDALTRFMIEHGRQQNNRLLIYFMGHGTTLKNNRGEKLGYFVSKDDVRVNSPKGKARFIEKAIAMEHVSSLADTLITAKHTLLIIDACFSGHAIRLEDETLSPPAERKNWDNPITQVITAGDASQRVPANSIFTRLFLQAVTTARADQDGDGFLTGSQLGVFLYDEMSRMSDLNQTPYTSNLLTSSFFDEPGEFVFRVPRDNP